MGRMDKDERPAVVAPNAVSGPAGVAVGIFLGPGGFDIVIEKCKIISEDTDGEGIRVKPEKEFYCQMERTRSHDVA